MVNNEIPVLEREIRKGELVDGEFVVIETKKVGELIEENKHIFYKNGRMIINHTGVLRLAEFVGAHWGEPRLDDRPTSNNEKGFYYMVPCYFPDGSVSYNQGEANEKNTDGIGKLYKQSTALVRGMNRSFLRSNYIKMYDVYSEEEAEGFNQKDIIIEDLNKKTFEMEHRIERMTTEYISLRKEHAILKKLTFNAARLPLDDEKYPDELVKHVWSKHKNKNYMEELVNSGDPFVKYVALEMVKIYIPLEEKREESYREDDGEENIINVESGNEIEGQEQSIDKQEEDKKYILDEEIEIEDTFEVIEVIRDNKDIGEDEENKKDS